MIEESYVSLDTANMLKEAGFDIEYGIIYAYDDGNNLIQPAQALAARWLFERHGIFIEDYILVNGQFAYRLFRNGRNLVSEQSDMYESLQECIEDALQEALRLILKNKDNEPTND